MTRLFLVAGEASGDLQGGLLAEALRIREPGIRLEGIGGTAMEQAGVRLLRRCEEMAVTGLWEVVRHLPRFRRILREVGATLAADPPDALVPIDYPDFNLRLAARARAAGIPVVYYISPQVWAWRRGRIRQIARAVRRMIVIFPFEEDLYRRAGVPVTYVGHPLVDRVAPARPRDETRSRLGLGPGDHLIALLPGSRPSEVERILPVLLETRTRLSERSDMRWVLALAPGLESVIPPGVLREAADRQVTIRSGETYDLLAASDLVLTASGTATLEAALLGAPMLVVYRMHPLTWELARRLVRIDHIAMANLLAGRRLVPEFLQNEARAEILVPEVVRWIDDPALRARTRVELRGVAARLGPGGAAGRAAAAILEEVRA